MSSSQAERAKAEELPEGDVIRILLEQHARIRDLFREVRQARGEQRKELFNQLRGLLAVHETAEEMILRPVAKMTAGEEEAEARNREEQEANEVLADLEKLDVESEEFEHLLSELEQSVSEHADHEEGEEFPAVRRGVDEQQLKNMGRRLLAAEKTAPTRPHPTAAGSPAAQWTVGPFASLLDRAKDALNQSSRS